MTGHAITKELGKLAAPTIMSWGTALDKIPQTDENVVKSDHVYPGSNFCNSDSPHALWHEMSAQALMDLVFFVDEIDGVLRDHFAEMEQAIF